MLLPLFANRERHVIDPGSPSFLKKNEKLKKEGKMLSSEKDSARKTYLDRLEGRIGVTRVPGAHLDRWQVELVQLARLGDHKRDPGGVALLHCEVDGSRVEKSAKGAAAELVERVAALIDPDADDIDLILALRALVRQDAEEAERRRVKETENDLRGRQKQKKVA
jgi:hypothetical protein